MERALRELRLQEERAFLRSVACAEDARAPPIVPEPLDGDAELEGPTEPLSPRDCSAIAAALSRSAFLQRLGQGCPQALAQSFIPVRHGPGDTVLAEGDEGTAMFVVAEGQLAVTQNGRPLRTLGPGDVFGELAILYHCKRTATVRALGAVRLWAIARQRYRAVVTGHAKRRRADVLRTLRTVQWLQGLSDTLLSKLLDAMEECSFAPGHVIIHEGDEGQSFYIILSGEVRVSRRVAGQEREIRVLGPGEHFGEISLLQRSRRTATCRAQGDVTCVALAEEAAPSRLEELEPERYEEGPRRGRPVVLGAGGFGRVELVRWRQHLLALKRIRKDRVVQQRQQEHVRTERRVLARSRCPFVVGFWGSFRDRQYVYLLLEFCPGGELWSKLREVRCFEEPTAVFCAACVVEALEYLHGHGVVYRDLKPENLMLDQQGYVKLVDFGLAKELARGEKTFSLCGTPQYLAPEVLRQEGHDFAVDFWALGVLVYEMLVGRPPFHGADPQSVYSRILDGVFSFPAFLSDAACSLVSKLCRRRPGQRLGCTASGVRGLRRHRWFAALPWRRLRRRQLRAPTLALVRPGPPHANFRPVSAEWGAPQDELSGWDQEF
ncbi:cGMP-dependent protein kinase 1-like [Eudromia elegans]